MRAVLLALVLSGCASAEPPGAATVESPAGNPPATVEARVPASAVESPPGEVVRTCKVDTDCAVKNVGSCCGYFPACVAKDSPTFPERVKAECAAKGISSICGFQEPAGCACVDGVCESTGSSSSPGGSVE